MGSDFLFYCRPGTIREKLADESPLDYAASNQFGRVQPDDTLWVVTANQGELVLVSRLRVSHVTDRAGAERALGRRELWDASLYALALPGAEEQLHSIPLAPIVEQLEFETDDPAARRLIVAGRRVNAQQLQTLRQLTAASAETLRVIWESTAEEGSFTSALFRVGEAYTRKDVYRILGVPEAEQDGDWDTGYHRRAQDYFIFANVGTPGRSGPGYDNRWEGVVLRWRGRTGSNLQQPRIQGMLNPRGENLLFWRTDDRSPFTFAGPVRAKAWEDTTPVTILWEPLSAPSKAEDALEALEPRRSRGAGQGLALSAVERRAIELRAMKVASEFLWSEGYSVEDVSLTCSFDLLCSKGTEDLHAEVKGTKGLGDEVRVTASEVRFARSKGDRMALLIVHSIKVEGSGSEVRATGGTLRVIRPWSPRDADLTPLAFTYTVSRLANPRKGHSSKPSQG